MSRPKSSPRPPELSPPTIFGTPRVVGYSLKTFNLRLLNPKVMEVWFRVQMIFIEKNGLFFRFHVHFQWCLYTFQVMFGKFRKNHPQYERFSFFSDQENHQQEKKTVVVIGPPQELRPY